MQYVMSSSDVSSLITCGQFASGDSSAEEAAKEDDAASDAGEGPEGDEPRKGKRKAPPKPTSNGAAVNGKPRKRGKVRIEYEEEREMEPPSRQLAW